MSFFHLNTEFREVTSCKETLPVYPMKLSFQVMMISKLFLWACVYKYLYKYLIVQASHFFTAAGAIPLKTPDPMLQPFSHKLKTSQYVYYTVPEAMTINAIIFDSFRLNLYLKPANTGFLFVCFLNIN